VSDGDVTGHRAEGLFVEDLADETEVLEHQHLGTVGHRDARGLLAAVLQGVQPVVREFRHVLPGSPDAEDAALLARLVLGFVGGEKITCVNRQIGTGHRGAP